MFSQGKELAAIDFEKIIGGPMMAVINAQAASANLTANFIKEMGFEGSGGTRGDENKLKVVSFSFDQLLGSGASGLSNLTTIKVPTLTLVPIPFLRVDNMTIQFNVKLVSTDTQKMDNSFVFSSSTSGGSGLFASLAEKVNFKASVTEKNTYQHDQVIDDTYSLDVTVHCVQDQLPAGLGQVLNIFSNLIQTQGTLIQTVLSNEVAAMQKQIEDKQNGDNTTH